MSQPLQVGTTLRNRYKIVQLLGSGGFGDTYKAVDLDLPGQPQCVVKHLKPKDPNPAVLPVAKSLFDREAQFLYQLGHESNQIPKLFAHFEENGEFYLVQEFVDGHDLSQEITFGKQLSESKVFNLLNDILEVLAVVHQHNVIHRDIKPQNLMRRRHDSKIVLIDFGAVKEIGALEVNTQGQSSVTVAIGSPGYMPPEQALGRPRLSSDVYAVGMLGIQALTGLRPNQLPIDPDTESVVWRNWAKASDAFADVLDRMVRPQASERYQSAAAALQALISTAVSPSPPPSVSASSSTVALSSSKISPVPSTPTQPTAAPSVVPPVQVSPSQPTVSQTQPPIAPASPPHPQSASPTKSLVWKALIKLGIAVVATTSVLIIRQFTPTAKYSRLQELLASGKWKEADNETAQKMWEVAGRLQERGLRAEDFEKVPCEDLRAMDNLWVKYSNDHFGFSVQRRIWLSSDVNSDLRRFDIRVGWGYQKNNEPTYYYYLMDGVTFDLSMPTGQLPWAPTYYGGNNETRKKYMARIISCGI